MLLFARLDISLGTNQKVRTMSVSKLRNLLINNDCPVSVKKEACWIISRIVAEKEPQIQAVIDEDIIGPLVQLLKSLEFSIKKEAVLALKLACFYGSSEQCKHIVERGCIKPVCNLLTSSNDEIVRHCLQLIAYILQCDKKDNNFDCYRQMIVDAGGWDKISFLENYGKVNDIKVYAKDLLSVLDDGEGPPW